VTVTVSTRHGHLTDEHQAQVREQAEKLLHFFDRLTIISVTVDLKQAGEIGVEVVAHAEHKHEFVGHAHAADLLAATHGAVEKAKQQIKHYKEKLQDHRRDPSHGGTQGLSR
jgi:putative sigma-54 modulation protein